MGGESGRTIPSLHLSLNLSLVSSATWKPSDPAAVPPTTTRSSVPVEMSPITAGLESCLYCVTRPLSLMKKSMFVSGVIGSEKPGVVICPAVTVREGKAIRRSRRMLNLSRLFRLMPEKTLVVFAAAWSVV